MSSHVQEDSVQRKQDTQTVDGWMTVKREGKENLHRDPSRPKFDSTGLKAGEKTEGDNVSHKLEATKAPSWKV